MQAQNVLIAICGKSEHFVPMDGFGERLRAAAEARHMTDADVARLLDISPRRFSHYVQNNREPPLDLLAQMATALSISADYLLGLAADAGRPGLSAAAPPPGFSEPPAIFDLAGAPGSDWRRPARDLPDGPFFLRVPEEHRDTLCAAYVLVDPDHQVATGCLVMAEDREGRITIGRWRERPRPGWISMAIFGGRAIDERNETTLRRVLAVTWCGITPPDPGHGIAAGQKARALAIARRNLKAVEDLYSEE